MDVGIPLERQDFEKRVGLSPIGVENLLRQGHRVYVESSAGLGSRFNDQDYLDAGATLAYSPEELYRRSTLIVKVGPLALEEYELLAEGQVLLGFQHLAVAPRNLIQTLLEKEVTIIAYETVQEPDDTLPILLPMSEIGGRMAAQIAAHYLEATSGGRGTLLSGVAGVPPAAVGILGAGVVGVNAARSFLGLGAQVTVLDNDVSRLRRLEQYFSGQLNTMVAHPSNIQRVAEYADVLVGAVLVPGARTPILVTKETVKRMRRRSVILDISIDQGGCVETSRPTTHGNPVFIEEEVIHYCVPNIPAKVPRTSTHALTNTALPYIEQIAGLGLREALAENSALARGVNIYAGHLTNPLVATSVGMEAQPLESLLGGL